MVKRVILIMCFVFVLNSIFAIPELKSIGISEQPQSIMYDYARELEVLDWGLSESFDDVSAIPSSWTVVDGDGDGYTWQIYTPTPHSSPNSAGCRYNASGNDDWLITPAVAIEAGYTLDFWFASQDASYLEDMVVALSTTSTATSAFTEILMTRNSIPTTWQHSSIDLSSWVGQTVYIGFHNVSVDEFVLKVDDVKIGVACEHDLDLCGTTSSESVIGGESWTPETEVRNDGTSTETFDVTCEVEDGGSVLYSNTQTVSSLAPSSETTVTFPDYTPPSNRVCNVTYSIDVAGDCTTENNTIEKILFSYTTLRRAFFQKFTSTGCPYCPRAAEGLRLMQESVDDAAIVADYHSTLLYGADPYYLADCASMATYYGVSGYPHVWCVGILNSSGGYPGPEYGSPTYINYFNAATAARTCYDLNLLVESVTSSGCTFTTNVFQTGELPEGATPKLKYALIESYISYTWGSSSTFYLDYLTDVVRAIPYGVSGVTVSGTPFSHEGSVSFDSGWNEENLYLIAYVQNDNTGEVFNVYQAHAITLNIQEPEKNDEKGFSYSIYPNPFNSASEIELVINREQTIDISVFDIYGRLVETVYSGKISPGTKKFKLFTCANINSGVYYVQMRTEEVAESQKLILIR